MNDCIKRSDAIKAFCMDCRHQDSPCEYEKTCNAMKVLKNKKKLPSADLNAEFAEWAKLWFKKELEADRPQGEWEIVTQGWHSIRRCSNCKWTQTYSDTKYMGYRYNFCPNCGARMKGADDE